MNLNLKALGTSSSLFAAIVSSLCPKGTECIGFFIEIRKRTAKFITQYINRRRAGKSKSNYAPSQFGKSTKRRRNRFVPRLCNSFIRIVAKVTQMKKSRQQLLAFNISFRFELFFFRRVESASIVSP